MLNRLCSLVLLGLFLTLVLAGGAAIAQDNPVAIDAPGAGAAVESTLAYSISGRVVGSDGNGFGDVADGKDFVNLQVLTDLQHNAAADGTLESGDLNFNAVVAGEKCPHAIETSLVGSGGSGYAGLFVDYFYGGGGYHGVGGIGDAPADGAGGALAESKGRREKESEIFHVDRAGMISG